MAFSSSSSASMPSRVKPPSRANAGGSSMSVRSIEIAHVGQLVELGEQAAAAAAPASSRQRGPHARDGRQRLPQRHEVARAGRAERRARHEPLEVVNRLERLAELAAIGRAERELLHGVEPVADALERAERAQQPRAQQPAAHRRDRAIDLVEQRALRRSPSLPVTTSRCLSVIGSMTRQSAVVL